MTPEEAIALLDKATSLLSVNRKDHENIIQALNVLNDLVKPKKEEKKK